MNLVVLNLLAAVEEGDIINLRSVSFESKRTNGEEGGGQAVDTDDHVLPEWGFRAGPRKHIWFNPEAVSAAVVTTGGVCPGINVVVHNIVKMLHTYGVPEDQVLGIQYGFKGLLDRSLSPVLLTSDFIQGIQNEGGSILGTSRQSGNVEAIVKRLKLWELDMLFVVGGRDGNKMVAEIERECKQQGLDCAVVGVPKSMDNSILIVDRSFGFDSAVSEAQQALATAKVEATSARNGIGLVKLMGMQSGFVAMAASMASGVVDVCLIPEVPFAMENVCRHVEKLLEEKQHCVICLADGAVDSALDAEMVDSDEDDIGLFIKRYLHNYFEGDVDIKYIDPTYMIRAGPVTNIDKVYCKVLGQAAVDTAFSGITGVTVGMVNNDYVLLPASEVSRDVRKVNPDGRRWNRVKLALRQPDFIDDVEFSCEEDSCDIAD
ncbi:hypothetical protein BSKO_00845 [Bryopsis sp. KO-2023]|nr:hypothetical protein BSKO_00845 [Bryopsis sp. KO-2023]